MYPPQPQRYATPKLGTITRPQVPVYVHVSGAQRPQNPVGNKPQVNVYQGQGVNSMPQGSTTVLQKCVRLPLILPPPEIQEGASATESGLVALCVGVGIRLQCEVLQELHLGYLKLSQWCWGYEVPCYPKWGWTPGPPEPRHPQQTPPPCTSPISCVLHADHVANPTDSPFHSGWVCHWGLLH